MADAGEISSAGRRIQMKSFVVNCPAPIWAQYLLMQLISIANRAFQRA